MSIKYITLFPEYAVPSYVASSVSKQELQKEMESKITQLKKDLGAAKPVHAESKQALSTQDAYHIDQVEHVFSANDPVLSHNMSLSVSLKLQCSDSLFSSVRYPATFPTMHHSY